MKRRWTALVLFALMTVVILPGFAETRGCSHQWKLERRTEPTCTGKGKEVYRCTLCGKTKTEKLPALGHDWSYCTLLRAPTCTEQGVTRCYCSRNPEHYKDTTQDALGHDWGEWETVRAPWLTQSGLEQRMCSRCGEKETQQIPPLIRRKEYELTLFVFPDENTSRDICAEQITQAGETGLELEWICAAANTGNKDLWIRTNPEDSTQERVPLPAGETILISVYTTIQEADLIPDTEMLETAFRLIGETEGGEQVCETGPVSGFVRISPAGMAEQPAVYGLEVRQELLPDSEGGNGYRMGSSVSCSVTVLNRGTADLSGVVLRSSAGEEVQIAESLAPGATRTAELEHIVIRQDAIAGYICWTVTAEATPTDGKDRISAQSNPLIIPVRAD